MSFTERLSLTVILNYFKILRACLNVSRALGPDPTKHETSPALVPKPACKPSASLSKPGSTAQCFRLCEALWLGCFTQEEKKKRRDKTCIWEYLQQLYNTSTILSWNQIALLLDFSFLKTKRRLFYETETTLPKHLISHWLNINTSESLPHFKIFFHFIQIAFERTNTHLVPAWPYRCLPLRFIFSHLQSCSISAVL